MKGAVVSAVGIPHRYNYLSARSVNLNSILATVDSNGKSEQLRHENKNFSRVARCQKIGISRSRLQPIGLIACTTTHPRAFRVRRSTDSFDLVLDILLHSKLQQLTPGRRDRPRITCSALSAVRSLPCRCRA